MCLKASRCDISIAMFCSSLFLKSINQKWFLHFAQGKTCLLGNPVSVFLQVQKLSYSFISTCHMLESFEKRKPWLRRYLPQDWPVRKPWEHFLDWWLMWKHPAHLPFLDKLYWHMKAGRESHWELCSVQLSSLGSTSVPVSQFLPWFSEWWWPESCKLKQVNPSLK